MSTLKEDIGRGTTWHPRSLTWVWSSQGEGPVYIQARGTIFNRPAMILAFADDVDEVGNFFAAMRDSFFAQPRSHVGIRINKLERVDESVYVGSQVNSANEMNQEIHYYSFYHQVQPKQKQFD